MVVLQSQFWQQFNNWPVVRYFRPKGFWKDDRIYNYAPKGWVFIGSLLELQNTSQVFIDGRMRAFLSTNTGKSKRHCTLCLANFDLWLVLWIMIFFFFFTSFQQSLLFQFPNSFRSTRISSYGEHVVFLHTLTRAFPGFVVYATSASHRTVRYILIFFSVFCTFGTTYK